MPDECTVSMEGCNPPGCCIVGSSWGAKDNGGYLDENPGTEVLPDDLGRILIAQFSLPDGTCFSYQGTANYNIGGGELTAGAFLIEHCICLSQGAAPMGLLIVLDSWGPCE